MYQKFLIRETDRFEPFYFPQLEESLDAIAGQLAQEPPGQQAAMVLSYIKSKTIPSDLAARYPVLAAKISSGSLDTSFMADLFASSQHNLLYRKELETYIENFLQNASHRSRQPVAGS